MRQWSLFSIVTLFLSESVAAADWRLALIGEDEVLGETMTFVDSSKIERDGDQLRMWIDMRIERPPVNSDGERALVTAHCSDRWFEVSDASYYVGERWLKSAPTEARQVAPPGSNMYMVLENVCAGRFLSGTVDPVQHVLRVWGRN